MESLKRVGLYGISGTGKTTILRELIQLASNTIWLEGARLVLEAAKLPLENFKRLPDSEKYRFRELAIFNALEIQKSKNKHIIIDGHLAFAKGENEFEDVMTEGDKRFYTNFVYLNLRPEIILERQKNDLTRNRNYSLSTIRQWIGFELSKLTNVCDEFNIGLNIVESDSNHDCIALILKLLSNPR